MKHFCNVVCGFVVLFYWLAGIVLASGFWSTAVAIFFPLWAWYLVVERVLIIAGCV